jgi:hypothetical protein
MPTPLSPCTSQEITPISPLAGPSKRRLSPGSSGTLPKAKGFDHPHNLKVRIVRHVKEYERKEEMMSGKRNPSKEAVEKQRSKLAGLSRAQVTEHMVSTNAKLLTSTIWPLSGGSFRPQTLLLASRAGNFSHPTLLS